jgi:hypothetical protein
MKRRGKGHRSARSACLQRWLIELMASHGKYEIIRLDSCVAAQPGPALPRPQAFHPSPPHDVLPVLPCHRPGGHFIRSFLKFLMMILRSLLEPGLTHMTR